MLLTYPNEAARPAWDRRRGRRGEGGYDVFHGEGAQRGVVRSGEPLLRVSGGQERPGPGRPSVVGMVVVAEDPAGAVEVDDHRQWPADALRAQDPHRYSAGRAAGHGGVSDVDG